MRHDYWDFYIYVDISERQMKGATMKLWFWRTITNITGFFYWKAWTRFIREYGKDKPKKESFDSRMSEAELDQ
jgi:hypothetical protein